MRRKRRRHRRYNNHIWLYSVIASICLLTMGVGYAILSAENNIQIDVTKKAQPGAGDTIKELLGSSTSVASGTGTLEKINQPATAQTAAQTEYRYRGSNPNNYVTFNNEEWRIIGIVDGKVKLIKNESIGNYAWNSNKDEDASGGALQNYLNDDYDWDKAVPITLMSSNYMNITNVSNYTIGDNVVSMFVGAVIPTQPVISKNEWPEGSLQVYLNGDYYNGLTSTAQSMIEESTWYLGGWNTNQVKTNEMYEKERGTTVYNSTRSKKTTDKIAIMYPSDYGYGAPSSCTQVLDKYDTDTNCAASDWLFKSIDEWTLTPKSGMSSYAFDVDSSGFVDFIDHGSTVNLIGVRPVLYLKSEVRISSGEGTKSKPYTLQLN